jgi:uncharacterized membrane protein YtjA (UPF0391 family)
MLTVAGILVVIGIIIFLVSAFKKKSRGEDTEENR